MFQEIAHGKHYKALIDKFRLFKKNHSLPDLNCGCSCDGACWEPKLRPGQNRNLEI